MEIYGNLPVTRQKKGKRGHKSMEIYGNLPVTRQKKEKRGQSRQNLAPKESARGGT